MIAEPVPFSTSTSNSSYEEEFQFTNQNVEEHPFQNICIEGPISQTKFPVYLISSLSNQKLYAMKMFPYYSKKPSQFFHNESRFMGLDHPNVISPMHTELENEHVIDGQITKISYAIMEYAPYGNLFRLIKNNYDKFDDKLIRTFFHQLVEGIGYLHE